MCYIMMADGLTMLSSKEAEEMYGLKTEKISKKKK